MNESDVRLNQDVQTPNGPGVVQGYMVEGSDPLVLVRHRAKEMVSHEHGKVLTKLDLPSPLYLYPASDLSVK